MCDLAIDSRRHEVTYRDVGLSLCAVESELQGLLPVEEGEETLGPKRGNEISEPQPPVEAEDSVDVQSQTAAVVHQDAQLLPLGTKTSSVNQQLQLILLSPSA